MSEIKHTFQAGRMNKDLDERLVPQGEYRDALNIEVRTSDDSDAGTVQTLYGNKQRVSDASFVAVNPTINWSGVDSRFVGSIADNRTDKAYFFIASPQPATPFVATDVTSTKLYKDMIVMYDNVTKTLKPVVTDIFRIEIPDSNALLGTTDQGHATISYEHVDVTDELGKIIRPGMRGRVYGPSNFTTELEDTNEFIVREVAHIDVDGAKRYRVYFTTMVLGLLADATTWVFEAENTLNFSSADPYNVLITGINIIDNLLFWTDNKSEPKKINIDRCIGEVNTVGESFNLHSRLKIVKSETLDTLEYALPLSLDPGLKEEHISVIRRAPRTSLRLEMSSFEDGIESDVTGTILDQAFVDASSNLLEVGAEIDVEISGANYSIGKTVILENDETPGEIFAIVTTVVSTQFSGTTLNHTLRINSINSNITGSELQWKTFLEQAKPLFELDLGRFSYRYKYQDGEYSSFAPWSELAFLPGKLDYIPKKGYNLGMVNTLRYLRVTDFVTDDYQRPDDIIEVEILYKDTVSPNVRVVKSVRRNDSEWSDNSDIGGNSGVVNISSEMMHRTLPSSQILRAWDNVPRQAKAQEVVGNRILYGNYLQNFDIVSPPIVNPGLLSTNHPGSIFSGERNNEDWLMPTKSLKSIRKYKIGVVFGDKYGRETPVMGIGGEITNSSTIPSSVSVEKKNSSSVNQLQAELSWKSNPESWMEYYKYYVKETTNEYYNLVLHRWYNAEDGNVWLAFGSADRNKVDEENYLILKNNHGSENPVSEEARYKILAIANEAPDFVKITEKVIGEAAILDDTVFSDIHESMIVDLNTSDYDQQLADTTFKGIGFVRIKAVVSDVIAVSRWVRIAQMKETTDNRSIVTTEPFGESAKLYDNFGLNHDDDIAWSVEVKDDVVENRPEFDGRFFVKVVRDGVLSANILQSTDANTNYNILNTFNFSSISTVSFENPAIDAEYQGDYAGVTSPSPGTLGSDKTGDNWDTGSVSVDGISSAAQFDNFANGCGDNGENTQEFWASNQFDVDISHNGWFIDESRVARSFSGGNEPSLDDLDATAKKGIRNSNNETLIDFSIVGERKPGVGPVVPEGGLPFQEFMQTNGTLFKFISDPFEEVYRVVSSTNIEWNANFNESSLFGCKKCSSKEQPEDGCYRATFTVSFIKTSDGQPLDANVWDPRSVILHDGTESSKISIVEPAFSEGSTLDFKTGNAVWETEPKENVDLDLYYEATDALPIKLSQENIESFCPEESPIVVHRPGAVSNPVFVANNPVVDTAVRDVIGVRDFGMGATSPFKIAINDTLKFTHADGMITEAKVVDHMHPIDSYSNDYSINTTTNPVDPVRSVESSGVATYKSSTIEILNCVAGEGVIDNDEDIEEADETVIAPPPEVGTLWSTTESGLPYDGVVIERKAVNSEDDSAGYYGFILIENDESIPAIEGRSGVGHTNSWSEWEQHYSDIDENDGSYNWPAISQLNLIYEVYETVIGDLNFTATKYWSSNDADSTHATVKNFSNGQSKNEPKTNENRVRSIYLYNTSVRTGGDSPRNSNKTSRQTNLALNSTPPDTFTTGGGSIWQAVSATNTSDSSVATLPIGMFITEIDGTALTYTTSGDGGSGLSAGSYTITFQEVTGYYKLDDEVHTGKTILPWFNCYSFGNGLESDRIRDDFNAPQIDNGVNVSTLLDTYREERRGSGMIYSGIYNSTSSVNDLNEFNMSEKITKDLNPSYGSIQALKTRNTNVVALCEDKVFKVLANKDALFNADGNVNLVSSDRVLGDASAFAGEYGISSNPESLAVDGYRMYFTDKQRNKVLRLSMDGITPISDAGMTSFFRDNLNSGRNVVKQELIGTFDSIKGEYNLSLRDLGANGSKNADKKDITISYNEKSKGWSSFKSFVPETGLSINDEYLTGKIAKLWSHHDSTVNANTFYGETSVPSTIDVLFNDGPGSVKSFLTMNYEGSQAKVDRFTTETVDGNTYNDGEYYNLSSQEGWYVESFNTDLQEAQVPEFKQKEGKWFNYISGVETTTSNLDTNDFSVQGIGVIASTTTPTVNTVNLTIRENND